MTHVGLRAQRAILVRVAAVAALAFVAQVGTPQFGIAQGSAARQLAPIVYTLRAPQPATHVLQVEATVPTERRDSVDLMMAIWSPGYYRVEHYESRVRGFVARAADGTALRVTQPVPNRWRVFTEGRPSVNISYEALSQERSVTLNWVDDSLAVLNGAPTFITIAERAKRRHDVRLELAGLWKQSITSLAAAPDGASNHYIARDYDELVDSPIVAGDLRIREFTVGSTHHVFASAGDIGAFDDARAARDLAVIVEAQRRFWGALPYSRYVLLNLFRRGGGGLEHLNSTLLTSSAARMATPRAYLGWLQFVSHEYFHAMNVKRLRPVELGPFDYERPPNTTSLWISEGLTSYYGELLVQRSGLSATTDALATLSSHIVRVQNAPGRLLQTLEQSSLDVRSGGVSGIGRDTMITVSYYEKGPVVGFLLDARIRRLTNGLRSLDDVMRLAFKRHSGERGFTAAEFQKVAEEVAGTSLAAFFRQTLASTEELDYSEALDWFGLQFTTGEARATGPWLLAARADATAEQQAHLRAWLPGAP